jgi:hypothetical protein
MNESKIARRLYLWSFLSRFLLGLIGWLVMVTGMVQITLLEDALRYEQIGAEIAQDWVSGGASEWLATEGQRPHYPLFMVLTIACFYTLTLGVRAFPLLLAFYCAMTSFAPVYTYRIARQLDASPRAAAVSGWLVAFSPAFAFWCGALYKEGLILAALSLTVYHALRLQDQWRARSLLMVAAGLLALAFLRLYVATLTGAVLCLGLMFGQTRVRSASATISTLLRQATIVALCASALLAIGVYAQLPKVMPRDLDEALRQIEGSRNDLARSAESGYLRESDVSTPEKALQHLPAGLAYFLAVPLPWQFGSPRQNLAIPDTAFWVFGVYPLVLVGMLKTVRRNPQGTLLILGVSLAICGFYALFMGNIGTAYRLRVQVWLLWAVFAGVGWEALRGRLAFSAPSVQFRAGSR